MSRYEKSIVAAGHEEVCRAAGTILAEGGNAFDAVVAAGFASAVVEPALTSLGGGGLMVGYNAQKGQELYYDFFVDTPGRGGIRNNEPPDFFPVTVNFSGTSQDFNVGLGSVAVPGTLKGLLHIHNKLGRIGLKEVIRPARELAADHVLNQQQAHFLRLLYPIMTISEVGKKLYEPGGSYLQSGDRLCNPELAGYLDQIAIEGDESFYRGEIASAIVSEMAGQSGLLTMEDMAGYRVHEAKPLRIPYRGYTFLTPSEPSMGGTLIGLSLSLLAASGDIPKDSWGSSDHLLRTVRLMQDVERKRALGITNPGALRKYLANRTVGEQTADGRLFSRGTTHVSIADCEGNCASMTCSNGEGSGYFAPGTGIMLNNMMGEDDLHPEGFHSSPPGQRVGSMMSPSLLLRDDKVQLVIGSGGSKRIRTAISQVISQVVDFGRDLDEAVAAPRLYWDEDRLQVEPGFPRSVTDILQERVKTVIWEQKDVYFGGVHAVIPGESGAGDPRRGGTVVEISQ
ncbi:gamma-glutamyltransferase family protein [Desulfopila sp. IMCC35008]|uniref:gamma-glutamyltransferase family protein n=1 Tax=Desulfopila sp. IMCC35008 TaxID=2653858 RepID=UPI0013D25A35|nr:gamma-glutamyltransferase [Desulfopila sp. IMCC35008]